MRKNMMLLVCMVLIAICCIMLVACENPTTSYKVEFWVGDNKYFTGDLINGVLTNMPQSPNENGYVFDGWYLDKGTWLEPLTIQALLNIPLEESVSLKVYAKMIKYTCDMDGKAHSFSVVENVDATCEQNGFKLEKCSVCNYEKNTTYYYLGHSLTSEITTPAKCGVEGIRTYTCTRQDCEYSYKGRIYALSHNYSSEITTPAKCGVEGVKTYTCTREGCEHSYTETVAALQHSYSNQVTTAAKCGVEGVRTYTCIRVDCGYSYTKPIAALSHTYESVDTIKPCVREGLRTYTCSRSSCGHSYTQVLAALGYHDCDKNGNCIRCNAQNVCSKYFVAEEKVIITNIATLESIVNDGSYLTAYNGNDQDVVIPSMFEGVVVKGLYMTFSGNSTMRSVYIPDTVENIGHHAFYCSDLQTVRMPTSLKMIAQNAFLYCDIKTIYLPKSVTSIGDGAFAYCGSLTTVYYEGTQEEWNEINVSGNNNDLMGANVVFNYVRKED